MGGRRIRTLAVLALLVLGSLAIPIAPASAATLTVTKTADTADGTCDADCSLREAIIEANKNPDPDVIVLQAGTTYPLTIAPGTGADEESGDLDIIGTDLTITTDDPVARATVDATGLGDRVFETYFGPENVALERLVITGGTAGTWPSNAGGGIFNGGVNLTLSSVQVLGNVAFSACSTNTTALICSGGAGGGIFNSAPLTIRDSLIEGNSSFECTFGTGCPSGGDGGGLFNFQTTATIIDSTFTENSAAANGGGIHNQDGTVSVTGSVIGGTAVGNTAGAAGGGISNQSCDGAFLTLTDTLVQDNISTGSGGGLWNNTAVGTACSTPPPPPSSLTTNVTIDNSEFSGNQADGDGGGIEYFDTGFGHLSITDSVVASNTSDQSGGGLSVEADGFLIDRSEVTLNTAVFAGGGLVAVATGSVGEGLVRNSTIAKNAATDSVGASGGGIFNAAFLRIESSTLSENTVVAGDGPALSTGCARCTITPVTEVVNSIFAANDLGGVPRNCGPGGILPVSLGHNLEDLNTCGFAATGDLVNTDPLLGPLAANGGPSRSYMPGPGSPAIDAGDNATCPAVDQRGFIRPVDGDGNGSSVCDIGSIEALSTAPVTGGGPVPEPSPQPATIACTPETATNVVGTVHEILCVVTSSTGAGGRTVAFTSTGVGSLTSPPIQTTDASGAVTATLTSDTPGEQTLTATVQDATLCGAGSTCTDTAAKTWEAPRVEGCQPSTEICGSDGDDVIQGTDGNDVIVAGAGDDVINCGAGNDTVIAGAGADTVNCGSGADEVRGGPGNDTLNGNGGPDLIFGGDGEDSVNGGTGADFVEGGCGADTLNGEEGSDTLLGQCDDDVVIGEGGEDDVLGGDGDDLMFGDFQELRQGSAGDVSAFAADTGGEDLLFGGDGDDRGFGGVGIDGLFGGFGRDRMFGGNGADVIRGQGGNDRLFGEDGDDILVGGDGLDEFLAGLGEDVCFVDSDKEEADAKGCEKTRRGHLRRGHLRRGHL